MASVAFSGPNQAFNVGDNSGKTSAEFNPPPEQSGTPMEPIFTVPLARNNDYVPCGSLLDDLEEKSARPASKTALVGPGGVGKSQLAIEFAHRLRERSPQTWIFWIHANNATRLESSYQEIVDRLGLSGPLKLTDNVFQLVNSWLHDAEHGRWVLIFDGLDNEELLHESFFYGQSNDVGSQTSTTQKPPPGLFPQCPHGAIVLTTRDEDVALEAMGERDIIPVNPMDESSGLALLRKKLTVDTAEEQDARELLGALDFMPLAIIQATAFMQQQAPRYSLSQYLKKFQESSYLHGHEAGHPLRDHEANNSTLTTWQISFDYIRQARPSAADLLSLMSFFDRQGIPDILLRKPAPGEKSHAGIGQVFPASKPTEIESHGSTLLETSNSDIEEDIRTLNRFSFISTTRDPKVFELHSLVQLAINGWLGKEKRRSHFHAAAMGHLDRVFPSTYEDQERCQSLFPHLKLVTSKKPKLGKSTLTWMSLIYKGAIFAGLYADFADLVQMGSTLGAATQGILEPDHPVVFWATEMATFGLKCISRMQQIEMQKLKLVEESQREWGEDDSLTVTAMISLVETYIIQGQKRKAYELASRVYRAAQEIADEPLCCDDYFRTLARIEKLGRIYMNQGRWHDAERLLTSIVQTREQLCGRLDPATWKAMIQLAEVYQAQGRWANASELRKRVLDLQEQEQEQELGEDDPESIKI
ncbi:uncharacterized protein BO97DRAFT_397572 [Aspergillus homomorphus CBS 101889]|uniref:TPR-like protein n=1 Tax=Aspergillus homomorphus (strain CBS 101889) TaxID=1450537 RepID=A0A395HPG4_ASPHC|nr:hypothetical protein BO97DRAFT_397572 [Aspergillus homomorphus CBS 101889]RAL08748.1 hypothetical protein BO97DRAFT_397572 [Aspergillus homomorphus CBS 101889]